METTKIGLDFSSDFEEAVLCCGYCDSAYLHHTSIEIFDRKEDKKKGTHIFVSCINSVTDNDETEIIINSDISSNQSIRRNSILIIFQCEECGNRTNLYIKQHKGNSVLEGMQGSLKAGR